MRFRTWPVAALGVASLLILIVVSLVAASRRAQEIYTQLDELNTHHRVVEAKLRRLRSDVHLSGIYIRDYLLDPQREHAPEYQARLAELRRATLASVGELRALAPRDELQDHPTATLEAKVEEYWQAFEPLFDWTPADKLTQSGRFLRREVLPRREAVLAIAKGIEELNDANLAAQRAEVTRRQVAFRHDLYQQLWRTMLLGVLVAVVAVVRLRVLERRTEEQRDRAQEAERQLRQLSQQLVAAQEEERAKLSRELHDHVGQMLTALRMELGRIERLRVPTNMPLAQAVLECRALVDDVVRTVRDLALGLRPSMLDDFGLQPALGWLVRDFRRRYGLRVELTTRGDLDGLPDPHRTCVYRIVQEALTNAVRHSGARSLEIRVAADGDTLDLAIADDGRGFDTGRRPAGFGLRGIEERVRELGGELRLASAEGRGTTVEARLPIPAALLEETIAHSAG